MKSFRDLKKPRLAWSAMILPMFLTPVAILFLTLSSRAASNIALWDTASPSDDRLNLEDRTAWKAVPSETLALETDPAKARSDPGYYGREYAFQGDAIVEDAHLAAVFWAAKGRVILYSRTEETAAAGDPARTNAPFVRKLVELVPLDAKEQPRTMSHIEILRNADDEVVLKVAFQGSPEASAILAFGRSEVIEIKPDTNLTGIRLSGALDYGIVPSFIGDDLIFSPEMASENGLWLPSENLFLGLLKGETSELVMTWPRGKQQLRLQLSEAQGGGGVIQSIDFANDGQSLFLAPLSAPGIWHKEQLPPSFLEKDVAIGWHRPFPARWKTQLYEEGLKTTFTFRESKGEIWRGVPGSYQYPVWFEGEQVLYHLSKKVPAKGDSLIYFLEGQDTPLSVSTPVDILRATLGRPMSEPILDIAGRKLRTHHRRAGAGVHRACTCGCTEAIQAVFEAGEEVDRKADIRADLEDMVYFVHRHVDRINEYRKFADELTQYLKSSEGSAAELKPFLEEMEQIAGLIGQEYSVQQENMKSFAFADQLVERTLSLTDKKDPKNLQAYMDLLKEWRAMGGAQDYVLAQCHTITRKLAQAAGYGCTSGPKAVAVAEQIRLRARQCLRNPDGYEIWADY